MDVPLLSVVPSQIRIHKEILQWESFRAQVRRGINHSRNLQPSIHFGKGVTDRRAPALKVFRGIRRFPEVFRNF